MRILDFVELSGLKSQIAENLPHGYRRILGAAVALAAQPEMLMMDEPTTGMNAQEVARMIGVIRKIQEAGVTILLVEHNMRVVMELCQRIIVLNFGKKLAEGTCLEIRNNPDVIQAYLGGKDAAQP
jgi:branched-chain amino acid transport system ATP-binding protein